MNAGYPTNNNPFPWIESVISRPLIIANHRQQLQQWIRNLSMKLTVSRSKLLFNLQRTCSHRPYLSINTFNNLNNSSCFCPQCPKSVSSRKSAVDLPWTSVYHRDGTVTAKMTVTMELTRKTAVSFVYNSDTRSTTCLNIIIKTLNNYSQSNPNYKQRRK